jgi:tetratricopeptide (TPR) repeat protein
LQRRGINSHAENVTNELASRWPTNVQVLSALAQLKINRREFAAANEIAETIRKIGGQANLASQISAAVLGAQQKYDESISVLQSVYEANPNSPQSLYTLVRAYSQAKEYDKAEALLESSIKANPANADALVLMGLTKLARNAPDQAVTNFKAAIEKQPKNPAGYSALANYYMSRKDYDSAMAVLQSGLREQPSAANLRLSQAAIFEARKDFDKAIAEYDAMLKDDPGSMVVANNLASLLTDRRGDQASLDKAAAVSAVLTKSQLPQFKDTLGWVYYRKGDYRRALPLLEEGVNGLPQNGWARYHLAMAYAAVGDHTKAAEQFTKADELASNDAELKEKISAAKKGG